MRQGDFSELLDASNKYFGRVRTLNDPLTNYPFQGNIIPPARLSRTGVAFLNTYPQPNRSDLPGSANYYQIAPHPYSQRKDKVSIDFNPTPYFPRLKFQISGPIYVLADNMTKIAGNHTFKWGGSYERSGENDFDQIRTTGVPGGSNNQNGPFVFTDTRAAAPARDSRWVTRHGRMVRSRATSRYSIQAATTRRMQPSNTRPPGISSAAIGTIG